MCLKPIPVEPARQRGPDFKGKLNIYVCEACKGHIVTRDVDVGTTPMFVHKCRATDGCTGMMVSSMYRVWDQSMRESHQWYRPAAKDVPENMAQHVSMGGLLLREAVFA